MTEGLDGLRPCLAKYARLGVRLPSGGRYWPSATIGPAGPALRLMPTQLARYAALYQAVGLVPIVEPEVLLTSPHSLAQCAAVTEEVLHEVFAKLRTRVWS